MKGLIIAAGYGTRFLPATKTVPKEMFPLISKPAIAFIVEEFIASGIKDIIFVTSRRKKVLEDYLDREMELEKVFTEKNEQAKLETIRPYDARFSFIRQQEMKGTGHAMLDVEPFIGDDPFVMAYPDDLHFGEKPLALQLVERYNATGKNVLATLHDPPQLERYGVLDLEDDGETIKGIVEKPAPGTAPSKEASIGRFLLTPDIFPILREGYAAHTGPGEFYHTYGLEKLIERRQVIHHQTEGKRLDTGTPEGYMEAIVEYAKDIPSLRNILLRSAEELKG